MGGDGDDVVLTIHFSPTLASILSVTAQADAGVVTVQWVVAAEVGTVAYDLQRAAGEGSWITVNAEPVFADNSILGGGYGVVDAGAQARQSYRYQILEYLDTGETLTHGPYDVVVTGDPGMPLALTAVLQDAGQLRLSWPGATDGSYLLESSATLGADAAWSAVPLATPGDTSALVPLDGATGFFRVFRLP